MREVCMLDQCCMHQREAMGIANENTVEEIETPAILHASYMTLKPIDAFKPTKVIAGHIESSWELNAKEYMAYMWKYLNLFSLKVTNAGAKPKLDGLYETFQKAFPNVRRIWTSSEGI